MLAEHADGNVCAVLGGGPSATAQSAVACVSPATVNTSPSYDTHRHRHEHEYKLADGNVCAVLGGGFSAAVWSAVACVRLATDDRMLDTESTEPVTGPVLIQSLQSLLTVMCAVLRGRSFAAAQSAVACASPAAAP